MTVVPLFDLLERQEQAAADAAPQGGRPSVRLVERAAAALREDFRRLRELEREFGNAADDDAAELELLRSVWRMFDDWAREAEQVLARLGRVETAGRVVPHADGLRDDYGFARARLSITPEQVIRAKQQVRRGEVVSAKELRDELRARMGS